MDILYLTSLSRHRGLESSTAFLLPIGPVYRGTHNSGIPSIQLYILYLATLDFVRSWNITRLQFSALRRILGSGTQWLGNKMVGRISGGWIRGINAASGTRY